MGLVPNVLRDAVLDRLVGIGDALVGGGIVRVHSGFGSGAVGYEAV